MSERKFSADFISNALDLSDSSFKELSFDRIWTDSRSIRPSDFFLALNGDRCDGHDFIPNVIQKGVKGFLVAEGYEGEFPRDALVIKVQNPLEAYRRIAKVWRSYFKIPVIAVAGSVGKTTTKDMLASIFSQKFKTAKTSASQNGYIGIPMTLLSWDDDTEAAVVEIGIDDKGAMESHLEIVRPTHGIITALGPEHLELLIDEETAVTEEKVLFCYLNQNGGGIFWNLDESWLKGDDIPESSFTFSTHNLDADYLVKKEGGCMEVKTPTGTTSIKVQFVGEHNLRNAMGAISIADSFGFSGEDIEKGLQQVQLPQNRMDARMVGDIYVLADCYNANPTSMAAAFAVLGNEYAENSKILVLGDMLELGENEEKYHRALAQSLVNLSPKAVFLFGNKMKWLKEELSDSRIAKCVRYFKSKNDLTDELWRCAEVNDVVLVKGSRGMMMEEVFSLRCEV